MSEYKKGLMLQIWRLQESQTLISILFYSLTLTGVYIDLVEWRFHSVGIASTLQIVILMTLMTFLCILGAGYIYDQVFNLWKERSIIQMKKNIFLSTHLYPKEVVYLKEMWLPFARVVNRISGNGCLDQTEDTICTWIESKKLYSTPSQQKQKSRF